MRVRMPNGLANSGQLRAIADLSRRLGNCVLDITTRQQIQLRGFPLGSVPEIWERLHGVNGTAGRFIGDRLNWRMGWPLGTGLHRDL